MTEATNEALFAAYLRGDGDALRILMERFGDALTLYINGYIHDIHCDMQRSVAAIACSALKGRRMSPKAGCWWRRWCSLRSKAVSCEAV